MKLDLHIHSHFSPDSFTCPLELVRRALALNYTLIAVTDHDSDAEGFDWLVSEGVLSSDGQIEPTFATANGCPGARLCMLPGQEITTATGHLLCIGARFAPCPGIEVAEALRKIHSQGGWGIAAHPFDQWRAAFSLDELESLPFDAIEVFNGGATNTSVNQRALDFALQHKSPGLGGSDAHSLSQLGRAFTWANRAAQAVTLRDTSLRDWQLRVTAESFQPRVAIALSEVSFEGRRWLP